VDGPERSGRCPLDGGPALFLLELQAAGSAVDTVRRMQRALRYAVVRRAATGAAIRWVAAVLVPVDGRCLCLVEAGEERDVLTARDAAGLHATPVRPAYLLSDPPAIDLAGRATPPESNRRDGRSRHDTHLTN
jgi:hypothetical protein